MTDVIADTQLLKASTTSKSTALAGAVAGVIRDQGYVEIQAIGAGAVNQAVKAIAIARGYLHEDQITITCIPVFIEIMIDGNERTAIRFEVSQLNGS